ncbi:GTPase Era [Trueperella pyogenes]|uniref:GTPase Era n=1 Tax=Trueperella pyogenes TaxID=1661 RepID=A0ABV3NDP2_9ACTO|nr:GTPase Era [Trueperella pyogenes]MBB3024512.1 GTP-binding protein Era [Trueperella pyogenes]MCI7689301.1 GTPase Era [Trueperella pyogenes]WHU56590.1 GTPase Era [Trueperella pyogenes]WHU59560.1 GTPase Era [Trueperella pyogenes]WHU61548.1 GTPase Era [Trueperella pyogenes]
MMSSDVQGFRAGFVSVVGRPNAGKSTLLNAMVGRKIAITADQPETTRRVIRGIVQLDEGQLIVVDTPGLHRPRTLLGERLNDMVGEALSDVDAVALCMPADEPTGPGDRFLLDLVKKTGSPILAVITKTDKVTKDRLAERIVEVSQMHDFAEIVPVSAVAGEQVELLASLLLERMPPSPPLYPRDSITDESEETLIAELIREAALLGVRDELPHSIAVVVDELEERPRREGDSRPPILAIHASLYVERASQKGIIIGKGGSRLKRVGRQGRESIERLLGRQVYLDLYVKVAKEWQRDPKMLGRLGF